MEDILKYWSFVFLGVLVYSMGQGVKIVFPTISNHKWYQRTIVFHAPVLATALAAVPWFPMPDTLDGSIGTRLLYGVVAGISASWTYKGFTRLLGRDTKNRAEE